MTLPPLIISTLFAILTLALVVANFSRPKLFLGLVGFCIPLVSIQLTLGVNVFLFSLVGPLSYALLRLGGARHFKTKFSEGYGWFVGYVVLLSIAWMAIDYTILHRYEDSRVLGLGFSQTELKMPVQLIGFATQLLAFWIIPSRAVSRDDVAAGIRGLTLGCLVSIGVGIALRMTTGMGVLGRPAGARFSLGSSTVSRLGGLSGEPKHLGALLIVTIAVLVALYAFGDLKNRVRNIAPVLFILLIGLFLTYSTSAWVAGALVVSLQLGLGLLWKGSKKTRRRRGTVVIALTLSAALATQSSFVQDVLESRITDRLVSEESSKLDESKDSLVWDIYADRPYLAVLGLGMGGTDLEAVPYFLKDPKYSAHHLYSRTPTPSTNGIRLLGDIGLIGLLLFGFAAWTIARRLRKSGEQALAIFSLTGLAGLMLVSINAIAAYCFLLGAGVALLRIQANESSRS